MTLHGARRTLHLVTSENSPLFPKGDVAHVLIACHLSICWCYSLVIVSENDTSTEERTYKMSSKECNPATGNLKAFRRLKTTKYNCYSATFKKLMVLRY